MHRQLQAVVHEFHAATERLYRLVTGVSAARWPQRTDQRRWSVAECIAHLNLTAVAYLPLLETAVAQARRLGGEPPRCYRRDPVGWLLWRTGGPPARIRVKTTAAFIPQAVAPVPQLVAEFERHQEAQLHVVEAADGLPLGKVWIVSPFNARLRYNLFSCLTLLPRHQHRHLWQAEGVWERS